MTQEDKQLLLQDLCARLPYGVEIYYSETVPISTLKTINSEKGTCIVYDHSQWYRHSKFHIEEIKPYLRLMSSMTEEESAELSNIISEWFDKELFYLTEESFLEYALSKINYSINPLLFDWLNKKMFDYRGLIKRGLAITVTEENNPYRE